MTSVKFQDCTPLVPVSGIGDGVAFFRDYLGFEATVVQDGYAYLRRDTAAIRLISAAPAAGETDDPARQMSCYIDVVGVDAIFEAHREQLESLPVGHLRPPFNQDYGQREFHVIYETLLIFVGEAIPSG